MISFDDFKKLDIRVGKVTHAERVEGSEKLLKLAVDFGSENRQVVAGVGKAYAPEQLIDKLCVFAFNLEPRQIMGLESQGMILAADDSGPVILSPDRSVPPGSVIK